jgi:hypothetical protein
MTLQPIRDLREYKRLKESLKTRFETDRTGDQELFTEQTKIFQPLIKTQQDTSKALGEKITAGQAAIQTAAADALAPLTRELERRNDQAELPFYRDEVPGAIDINQTPEPFDPDGELTDADKKNLREMSFDLPSKVLEKERSHGVKNTQIVFDKIKSMNRSIGQKLGASSKESDTNKRIYLSRKNTLEIYRLMLSKLNESTASTDDEYALPPSSPSKSKKKSGQGVDTIYYPNIEELCNRLSILCAAKEAGNTGLNNHINAILDELLRVNAIDMPEYNKLYKKIFMK